MAMKDQDCQTCKDNFAASNKTGPRPEPAVARPPCPGCGTMVYLCRLHRPTWVACSKDCRDKWQAHAAKGLPSERLCAPAGAKPRKPRGYGKFQTELL
jgi:hypothetical protein